MCIQNREWKCIRREGEWEPESIINFNLVKNQEKPNKYILKSTKECLEFIRKRATSNVFVSISLCYPFHILSAFFFSFPILILQKTVTGNKRKKFT